jgi:DNA gyrase subunit A
MSPVSRPDLSTLAPDVRAYIEYLEAQLEERQQRRTPAVTEPEEEMELPPLIPDEKPTSIHLFTITSNGIAKRTARHLYQRQRRGGMGIFDLDAPNDTAPALLALAEENQHLLIFTDQARTFRIPAALAFSGPVRSRGQQLSEKISLSAEETIVAALPAIASGAYLLVSRNGFVRYLRHHVFGEYMRPGTTMYDAHKYGPLAAVCHTENTSDVLIVTQHGRAIRFAEKLIPVQGGSGMRNEADDPIVGIVGVEDDSLVFLADANGRGTIRRMNSFAANKSAGGGGKNIMNSDEIIGAASVTADSDIFLISQLSKIIRFAAAEVPIKEGVVQGVNCMSLRADRVVALAVT